MGGIEIKGDAPQDLVHGVHYFVDYYAVLGVPRTATPAELSLAYRGQMRLYHPDKYDSLAPDLQAQAAQRAQVLTDAKSSLMDAARRATYDDQLGSWDGPISNNGLPVISLAQPYYGKLHRGQTAELQDDLGRALAEIKQQSGHNPEMFTFIEQQYRATESPSPALEQAYRRALITKQVALGVEEGFRRDVIGLPDPKYSSPAYNYLETTKDELAEGRERVEARVEQSLLRLQDGDVKLLGDSDRAAAEAVSADPNTALAQYTKKALELYDSQAAEIEEIAAKIDETIDARLELVRGEYLPDQTERTDKILVAFQGTEGNVFWLAFRTEGADIVNDEEIFASTEERRALPPERIQQFRENGYTVMTVAHEEGLPALNIINAAVIRHFESLPEAELPT